MELVKQLELLFRGKVTKIVLKAFPPFIEMEFQPAELKPLFQLKDEISGLLSTQFILRRVFWERAEAEGTTYVLKSLEQAESGLQESIDNLAKEQSELNYGLIRLIRTWKQNCSLVRRHLQDDLDQIQKEKDQVLGYDSAGEDRFDAMVDRLTELRRATYPVVQALASFLDDVDPTKAEIRERIDQGYRNSPGVSASETVPSWDSPDI